MAAAVNALLQALPRLGDPLTIVAAFGVLGIFVGMAIALLCVRKGPAPTSLDQAVYKPFRLARKEEVTHNTFRFRFELPSPNHRLGLPVGRHILLRFQKPPAEGVEQKEPEFVSRPYTPVSSDDDLGYFDLVIKVYEKGQMSQHLKKLNIGETIEARGPQGFLTYLGNGHFEIKRNNKMFDRHVTHIGMIAGGTGITPMLQIIHEVTKRDRPDIKVSLIFANVTEKDILLREELATITERFSNIKVFFTLDRPEPGWPGGSGFVTPEMIKQHLPPPSPETQILVCGPPPMVNFVASHLAALQYPDESVYKY